MTTTPATATTVTKSRLILLGLLAVFVLPLLLAWLLVRGPLEWRPQSNLNYGALLQPPLHLSSYGVRNVTGAALTANAIARDWFVVVSLADTCSETCLQLVAAAEQIKIAVGGDSPRVNLAMLSPPGAAASVLERNWWLPADSGSLERLHSALSSTPIDAQLLLVDYQGYVVLSYLPTEDGLGVLEDLKRLLRSAAS
jgi:hypothetical protein